MKPRPRRKRTSQRDEPQVEAGGELMLAGCRTEGGAPFVLSVDAFRESNEDDEPCAGWARARHALARVCSAAVGRTVDVGFVELVGSGLSRDAYCAVVDDERQQRDVFALVPNRFAEPDYERRAEAELRLLSALGQRELGFRVPRVFGALRDAGGLILVEELVEGATLDLRAGRQSTARPWEVVAEVAAELHALPLETLPEGVLPPKDCRGHAESVLAAIGNDRPLLTAAREWMAEHLPPPEPGALLHGDLLGQNIRLGFDQPPGVIDWERAEIGDPAYELAVVTRGVRRPFQVVDGLTRFLEAYAAAGGRALSPSRVGFYELGILADQLECSVAERGDVQGADDRLRACLDRLRGSAAAK